MKAAVMKEYGPPEVIKIEEIRKPEPKENEVLIKVAATAICFGDIFARDLPKQSKSNFNMPSLLKPMIYLYFGKNKPKIKILGAEFSGLVEKVGSKVTTFKAGDEVFGYPGQSFGADAEYICLSEKACFTRKPDNLTLKEAASVPYSVIMANSLLKKVSVKKGDSVLVLGASGGIGSGVVQLTKNLFGARVTGVCSTQKSGFVKKLGADEVIDYTKENFTQNGKKYNLIFDVLGRSSFKQCKSSLAKNGVYMRSSFKLRHLVEMLVNNLTGKKKIVCAMADDSSSELEECRGLIEMGKFKAVYEKEFDLDSIAEAHRYSESSECKGKVVITVR